MGRPLRALPLMVILSSLIVVRVLNDIHDDLETLTCNLFVVNHFMRLSISLCKLTSASSNEEDWEYILVSSANMLQ